MIINYAKRILDKEVKNSNPIISHTGKHILYGNYTSKVLKCTVKCRKLIVNWTIWISQLVKKEKAELNSE